MRTAAALLARPEARAGLVAPLLAHPTEDTTTLFSALEVPAVPVPLFNEHVPRPRTAPKGVAGADCTLVATADTFRRVVRNRRHAVVEIATHEETREAAAHPIVERTVVVELLSRRQLLKLWIIVWHRWKTTLVRSLTEYPYEPLN